MEENHWAVKLLAGDDQLDLGFAMCCRKKGNRRRRRSATSTDVEQFINFIDTYKLSRALHSVLNRYAAQRQKHAVLYTVEHAVSSHRQYSLHHTRQRQCQLEIINVTKITSVTAKSAYLSEQNCYNRPSAPGTDLQNRLTKNREDNDWMSGGREFQIQQLETRNITVERFQMSEHVWMMWLTV